MVKFSRGRGGEQENTEALQFLTLSIAQRVSRSKSSDLPESRVIRLNEFHLPGTGEEKSYHIKQAAPYFPPPMIHKNAC